LESFKVIAFTHKTLPLELVGKLHLSPEEQEQQLGAMKIHFDFEELIYLCTCNRIELMVTGGVEQDLVRRIALFLNSRLTETEALQLASGAEVFEGPEGVQHLLRVASSLESLVVGEREIITQVRKAYDICNQMGLTGDFLRLLVRQTIETAKDIYTHTDIARNPVSVASLAYRQLRDLGIKNDARIIFVGAGETNTVLANYFQKHKFANFTVFNRSLAKATQLAAVLKGRAFELGELVAFKEGFDVLVVCTSSGEPVITSEIYASLNQDTQKKVIIDLGLPANVDVRIATQSSVHYIDINSLRAQADVNMQLRKNEITKCERIIAQKSVQFEDLYAERRVELAFGAVPKQVKAIRELAVNEVFAREINQLDPASKEVLEKVLTYMEKKYNAVAIKTAKEVLLTHKN
jgi:glutamyl-tRNA reductase